MSINRKYVRSEFDRLMIQSGSNRRDECAEPIVHEQTVSQMRCISSEQAEKILCQGEHMKWGGLIHFLFVHKETLKKIPVLGRILVKRKDMMLRKEVGKHNRQTKADLSDCMSWFVDDFIVACYQRLLGREPDSDGLAYYRRCVRDGASFGAVIYMIIRSEEFGSRVQVKHRKKYRKEYIWYICKRAVLRIPVVGHILALFTMPNMLKRLYDRTARNETLIFATTTQQMQQYAALQSRFEKVSRQLTEHQATVLMGLDAQKLELKEQQTATNRKLDAQERILARTEKTLGEILRRMESIYAVQQVLKDTVRIQEELRAKGRNLDNALVQINDILAQMSKEQENATNKLAERLELIIQPLEECRQIQTEGLSIDTVLSEKMDAQAAISSSLSEKLDALPAFIAANNVSSHTTVTGIPGGVIGVIVDGFTMGVPSEEWSLAMYLSRGGHFEQGSETFFEKILKPGMTVLDLGANLGIFTLRALRAGCKVFSYEPTPQICEILRQNIKVNGFAEGGRSYVMQVAVSDACGTAVFYEHDGVCGQCSSLFSEQEKYGITVQTVTLDSQRDLFDQVDVIKMDIEGAEYYALCGMRTLLEQNPQVQIVMEFAPAHLKRANVQPETLLQMIHELGFSIYTINEATAEAETKSEEELLCADTVNLYLKREG